MYWRYDSPLNTFITPHNLLREPPLAKRIESNHFLYYLSYLISD